ncbi:hypothetical protein [Kaistella sp.]|uniref:hypothetical protein n=1 Tax=Kaistella sp. TaxID=2782235 RepID=UPI00359FF333
MKYTLLLLVFSFIGCTSQALNSGKTPIAFEDVYHYPYQLISEKFEIIETHERMDEVFSIIHKNSVGNRLAPIPGITDTESYLIFKSVLKNSNDVEIEEMYLQNDILYIKVREFENPQLANTYRVAPDILVKLLKKVSIKTIIFINL